MSDDDSTLRSVHLVRTGPMEYRAENARGGVISLGEGQNLDFTPVELLLVALGGCNAITVEALTKRAEPRSFEISVDGHKVKDAEGASVMENLTVTLDITFDRDEAGTAMAERVPDAMQKSHDRLCTVSRTVVQGTAVKLVQVRDAD